MGSLPVPVVESTDVNVCVRVRAYIVTIYVSTTVCLSSQYLVCVVPPSHLKVLFLLTTRESLSDSHTGVSHR